MKFVPFTVHIRIVPDRPGKRLEHVRSMQKLAMLAYEAISQISGVNVATPGGGVDQPGADINRRGAFGSFANAAAVKPQMGQNPAQLMLTGFYESSAANIQPQSDVTRFSGGEVYTGPIQHRNTAMPSATVDAEVKTLKAALEAALDGEFPLNTEYQIFRIDYSGVVYGDRGFHFPR